MHNNPLIYIDPYGLWGESVNGYWNQAKEFGHGFSRGFVDDASFGATSCALGEHQTPTFNSKAAYYTGTGCSLAKGLVYGGTWAKGLLYGGKALNYGCKALKTAFQSTKSVAQTIKAAKSAVTHTPATKLFQKMHNGGVSAKREGIEVVKQINLNPLMGTSYTPKVIKDMSLNAKTALPEFHGFPKIVDNFAGLGRTDLIIGRDGITRTKVSLSGGYQGREGYFEWIIEPDKTINHRLFLPYK